MCKNPTGVNHLSVPATESLAPTFANKTAVALKIHAFVQSFSTQGRSIPTADLANPTTCAGDENGFVLQSRSIEDRHIDE